MNHRAPDRLVSRVLPLFPGWGASMQFVPGQSALVVPEGTAPPARPRRRPSSGLKHLVRTGPRSEDRAPAIPAYVAAILGGAVLVGAWLVPETGLGAWLGGM